VKQVTKLDELVEAIRKSSKYASVSEDLIRRVGADELAKRRSLKAAIKETKNALHQVAGLYRNSGDLGVIHLSSGLHRHDAVMQQHTSSRERLPILDTFYTTIFADIQPIHSVLDIGCGLNPLAIPFMPLAPNARYVALDVYDDLIALLNGAFESMNINATARVADVITEIENPESILRESFDVVLLLKTIPCLEQIDKGIGKKLLDTINAKHIVVSFPTRSVGGKNIGMSKHYEAHFNELVAGHSRRVIKFEFVNELTFRLSSDF
jgi:16S rRNA (guanine(1405)-N(7))-methyltransferase